MSHTETARQTTLRRDVCSNSLHLHARHACDACQNKEIFIKNLVLVPVADWLAFWTQAQKVCVQIASATLSGNSLRQTVHTHRASVHQAAKLVAALLRVVGVSVGLAKSNGSLPPGL